MRPSGAALACLLLLTCGCHRDGAYPSRPITLICPWAIVGGTDRVSRQLAAFLEAELEVPVSVLNATGGAGVTGHRRGARAAADGYTLTMITVEINMLHWRGLTQLTWRDFTPLMLVNRDAAAVFVRADAPWRSLAELTAAARAEPGKLKASGTATGGIWHLAVAGWLGAAGLSPNAVGWIPSQGAGPALQDLASGGLDMVCSSLPEARLLLGSGTVRSLGAMAPARVPGFEDVPTFREQGIDWDIWGWRGLALPRGAPREVVERLSTALGRIVSGETVVGGERFPDYMRREGFDASRESGDEFAATLERVDGALGKVLTSPGFRAMEPAPVPPMGFPAVLGIVAAAALVALCGQRLAKGRVALPIASAPENARQGTLSPAGLGRVAALIAVVVLYPVVVDRLGFILTSAAALCGLLLLLRTRPRTALWVTATVVLLVYQAFAIHLRVPLPRGYLGW